MRLKREPAKFRGLQYHGALRVQDYGHEFCRITRLLSRSVGPGRHGDRLDLGLGAVSSEDGK